jgi:hypothetical protein
MHKNTLLRQMECPHRFFVVKEVAYGLGSDPSSYNPFKQYVTSVNQTNDDTVKYFLLSDDPRYDDILLRHIRKTRTGYFPLRTCNDWVDCNLRLTWEEYYNYPILDVVPPYQWFLAQMIRCDCHRSNADMSNEPLFVLGHVKYIEIDSLILLCM